MNPLDAWTLRTLLVGRHVNGEMEKVSLRFRPIAERLAGVPIEQRAVLLDGFLLALPDVDEIRIAMAEADPSATAPDEDAAEEEPDWPPMRLWALPPVEPFPVEVYPPDVQRVVIEVARSAGCDLGLIGAPALALAAGLIGGTVKFLRDRNWFESSTIFHVNVSMPGNGKSQALRCLLPALTEFEEAMADEFAIAKQGFLEAGDKKAKPPVLRRLLLSDTTIESIGRRLAENPRGVLLAQDELSTLILGMNQYKGGKGNDAAKLMEIWTGAMLIIDRVMNEFGEPIRVPFPYLSIEGNLPPGGLTNMVNRSGEDGLLDRFLYTFPDRTPMLKSAERVAISNEALEGWKKTAGRLWSRQPDIDLATGRRRPHVIYFTDAGRLEFNRLYDEHVDEVNDHSFPDVLRGPWSKLEVYSARFCLILALLQQAGAPDMPDDILPSVNAQVVRDAWKLVGYFKSHHRRVRAFLEGRSRGSMPEGARLILNWIRNHPQRTRFNSGDITRAYPPSREYGPAMMEDGIDWLCDRNALRPTPQSERPKGAPGRKPSPTWDVHPDLRKAQENQERQGNGPIGSVRTPGSPVVPDSPDVPEGESGGGHF